MVRLRLIEAAGLIAGTVPTTGTESATRIGGRAMVRQAADQILLGLGAVGEEGRVGGVDAGKLRQARRDLPKDGEAAQAGIEDQCAQGVVSHARGLSIAWNRGISKKGNWHK
jgi:hypothetical protein